MVKIYCSSYCNQGHKLSDGKPINHECYILPVKALEAERAGNIDEANEILRKTLLKSHKGIRLS